MNQTKTKLALTALFLLAACNGKEGGDDKAAYEEAIKEVTPKLGIISAFKPHLDKPKPRKYDPEKRTDLDRAVTFAANEVRHAANGAAQRIARSKFEAVKALAKPFEEVAKACADVEGDEAAAKCKETVLALEKALADANDKAKAAGATTTFPPLAEASITDEAKKLLAQYDEARGPGEQEKKYLAMRRDESAKPADLAAACDAAAAEAGATFNQYKASGNEELHKVSAHHKAAVDGQCNRVKEQAGTIEVLEACKKEEGAPEEAECKLACSKAKGRIEKGIPAAPFERMKKDYEDVCEEGESEGEGG
ncbi:MAG TPA: hypothetical protein ENK57_04765 [Polyangiaceae bacterium]|nr:hypothetical protein [Polyangiaceae bacterium]